MPLYVYNQRIHRHAGHRSSNMAALKPSDHCESRPLSPVTSLRLDSALEAVIALRRPQASQEGQTRLPSSALGVWLVLAHQTTLK